MTYLATWAFQQNYTEMNSYQNTKLYIKIDEPLKAIKVIAFFFLLFLD